MVRKVGVPAAIDSRGAVFDRASIDHNPQRFVPPLSCGGGCGAVVHAVHGYTRPRGPVMSHYRLNRGQQHTDDCQYHFDAAAGRIVTEYRRDVQRRGDRYVLVLRDSSTVGSDRGVGGEPSSGIRSKLEVHLAAGAALRRRLQATAAIHELMRRFDHDPAARAAFAASYKGNVIGWDDFLFTAEDTARLAARAYAPTQWPITVLGTIEDALTTDDFRALTLRTTPGAMAPDKRAIAVKVYARNPNHLLHNIGDTVLAYGMWGVYPPAGRGQRAIVRLWVEHGTATRKLPADPD